MYVCMYVCMYCQPFLLEFCDKLQFYTVSGEIMQLKSVGKEKNNMFDNYLEKTYRKTATLMANSCKAVRWLLYLIPHVARCSIVTFVGSPPRRE